MVNDTWHSAVSAVPALQDNEWQRKRVTKCTVWCGVQKCFGNLSPNPSINAAYVYVCVWRDVGIQIIDEYIILMYMLVFNSVLFFFPYIIIYSYLVLISVIYLYLFIYIYTFIFIHMCISYSYCEYIFILFVSIFHIYIYSIYINISHF